MNDLTTRQREILQYIETVIQQSGLPPSLREIAQRFGFRSPKAVADHLRALERKGYITLQNRKARGIILHEDRLSRCLLTLPIYGLIPAGFAEERVQEPEGYLTLDLGSLGIRPNPRLFVLRVKGDSMIGRHICDGDYVILEHGRMPRNGDVVAALIDNESALKTFVQEPGKPPYLKAENPKYPELYPASELVIQGVMIALIRKVK